MMSHYYNTEKLRSKQTRIPFGNGHAFYHVAAILLFRRKGIHKKRRKSLKI